MMIHKAYKFRIYPNQEQQILIAKTTVIPVSCSTASCPNGTKAIRKQEKD